MPAKLPCLRPGCAALVASGYCERHASAAPEKRRDVVRGTANSRGYDAAWQRFRKWFLAQPAHMVCEDCGKRLAVDVHHVKKVAEFPELRLVESNCRGLCKPCHTVRTVRGE